MAGNSKNQQCQKGKNPEYFKWKTKNLPIARIAAEQRSVGLSRAERKIPSHHIIRMHRRNTGREHTKVSPVVQKRHERTGALCVAEPRRGHRLVRVRAHGLPQ